jgi:hypothetical protein
MVGRAVVIVVIAAAVLSAGAAPAQEPSVDDLVHLNEVQVIGSHNSYHDVASSAESELRRQFIGAEEDALLYDHAPLDEQFSNQKVRQIELDVFADASGGRYANPLLRAATGGGPYDPAMNQPGVKVLHVQDVDYRSTCLTLIACLQVIKGWSDANPTHMPLAILIELKDTPLDIGDFEFVIPEPFDATALDAVDAEIRSVFGEDEMITPDDVRGDRATLDEAVLNDGWPTLGDSRGQVLFLMDNGEPYRTTYLAGRPNLEGRVLFTNSQPGQADAAFVKRNDPIGDTDIAELVEEGYLVRTRADSDTDEARLNDTTMRDAALASGAQWVSTDYPVADYGVGFDTDYVAEIPGGTVARCNPVNAPPGCVSAEIDTILPAGPPGPGPTSPTTSTTAPPPVVLPATPAVPVAGTPSFTG